MAEHVVYVDPDVEEIVVTFRLKRATPVQLETPPLAVSLAEAARLLGAPPSTVSRWCRVGQLASIQVGRKRLVPVVAIEEMLGRAVEEESS